MHEVRMFLVIPLSHNMYTCSMFYLGYSIIHSYSIQLMAPKGGTEAHMKFSTFEIILRTQIFIFTHLNVDNNSQGLNEIQRCNIPSE